MFTCNDVVALALRLAGIVRLNASPKAAEAENGMMLLQGLYEGMATGGLFGRLTDVLTAVDYTANEGERVRATNSAVVTLPTEIRGDGGPRGPRDLSLIEIYDVAADHLTVNLFDRNAWVALNDLALTDQAPLAMRDRAGLAGWLAESYVEMFGGAISAGTAARARSFRGNIISKRGSTQDRPEAVDY